MCVGLDYVASLFLGESVCVIEISLLMRLFSASLRCRSVLP